jgi:hypothetical protein
VAAPATFGSQVNVQLFDKIIIHTYLIGYIQLLHPEARLINADVGLKEEGVAGFMVP